jgi:hypothetical protein
MTIDELIDELKEYPPETLVKVYASEDSGEWEQVQYLRFMAGKPASLLIW